MINAFATIKGNQSLDMEEWMDGLIDCMDRQEWKDGKWMVMDR